MLFFENKLFLTVNYSTWRFFYKKPKNTFFILFLKLVTIWNSIYWLWSYDLKCIKQNGKSANFHFWPNMFKVIAPQQFWQFFFLSNCKLIKILNRQKQKFSQAENAFLFLFLKFLTILNSINWFGSYDLKHTESKMKISTFPVLPDTC